MHVCVISLFVGCAPEAVRVPDFFFFFTYPCLFVFSPETCYMLRFDEVNRAEHSFLV